jgi:hypothetical protein
VPETTTASKASEGIFGLIFFCETWVLKMTVLITESMVEWLVCAIFPSNEGIQSKTRSVVQTVASTVIL